MIGREVYRLLCSDVGCVDVGIGVMHHPYCGLTEAEVDAMEPPDDPEAEETLPPDREGHHDDPRRPACICDTGPDSEGSDIECPAHGAPWAHINNPEEEDHRA